MEPVDIGKYEFIRMPQKEQWGVLVREDSPLAHREFGQDPSDYGKTGNCKNELAGWFGEYYDGLEIAATYNLLLNAANMVKHRVGAALCFALDSGYDGLSFVPLCPAVGNRRGPRLEKKNRPFPSPQGNL